MTDRLTQEMRLGTVRKLLVSMGQIFKYAARHKYISYNPFLDAERPAGTSSGNNKIKILTPI